MKGTQFTNRVLAHTSMRLLIAKTMVGVTPTISSGGGSQTVVIFRGTCFLFIHFLIRVQSFVGVVVFFFFGCISINFYKINYTPVQFCNKPAENIPLFYG